MIEFFYDRKNYSVKFGRCVLVGLILVFLLIVGCCGWVAVPPGHRGVAITMGSVQENARKEGFSLKLPFLTDVKYVSIQQQRVDGVASCFSSDLQTVTVAYVVLYRLPEGRVVELYQQYKGDPYQSLVDPRVQECVKQVTSGFAAERLVKSRDEIKTLVLSKIKEDVGDIITIVDLNIANIDLSNQLEQAIENKMVQEQESLAMKFKLEKAQKEAEIKIIGAKAEAESVKITGEALAKSPDVINLEIAKKWDGKAPHSVVVQSGGANVLLPLK